MCSADAAPRSPAVEQSSSQGKSPGHSTKELHSPHAQACALRFQDRREKKNFIVTCVSRQTFKLIWQLFCHSWYKAKGTEWHRTELSEKQPLEMLHAAVTGNH